MVGYEARKRFSGIREPRNGNLAAAIRLFLLLPTRIMIQPPEARMRWRAAGLWHGSA